MRLLYSPTSPYARKVRAVAIEKGIEVQLEPLNPLTDPAPLLAANPLAKVPCLLLDDDTPLYDSPVICEYLDAQAPTPVLLPPPGAARWDVLRRQALADGVMDLAVALRQESLRPGHQRWPDWQQRWRAGILRAVAHLEATHADWPPLDLGTLAAACALDYLDFRHPGIGWRGQARTLAAWLAQPLQRPSMRETAAPVEC